MSNYLLYERGAENKFSVPEIRRMFVRGSHIRIHKRHPLDTWGSTKRHEFNNNGVINEHKQMLTVKVGVKRDHTYHDYYRFFRTLILNFKKSGNMYVLESIWQHDFETEGMTPKKIKFLNIVRISENHERSKRQLTFNSSGAAAALI